MDRRRLAPLATFPLALLVLAGMPASMAPALAAQVGSGSGAAAFRQACLDATRDALVLNVAAHPDDEAARSMVFLRRHGLRTVTLYSTSGRGGQNAIGREIGEALARLRVRETLAAAEHTGTEVRWLGFPDFGYSKTAAETMRVWGEAELKARMRAQVRDLRPDLALTNHSTNGGHGHHRASAIALLDALADWRETSGREVPAFQRVFGDAAPSSFTLDVRQLDPITGLTYARQAYNGWVEHRTQGPWGAHDPMTVRPDRWKPLEFVDENAARRDLDDSGPERPRPTEAPTELVGQPDGAATASGEAPGTADEAVTPKAPPLPPVDPFAVLGSLFDEPAFLQLMARERRPVARLAADLAAFATDRPVAQHVAAARRLLPLLAELRAQLAAMGGVDASARAFALARLDRRIEALSRVVRIGQGVDIEAYVTRAELPFQSEGVIKVCVHTRDGASIGELDARWNGQAARPAVEGAEGARLVEIPFEQDSQPVDSLLGTRVLRPEVAFTIDGLPISVRPLVEITPVPVFQLELDRERIVVARGAGTVERVLSLAVRYHGDQEVMQPLTFDAPAGVTAEALPASLQLSPAHRDSAVLLRLRIDRARLDDPVAVGVAIGSGYTEVRLQPVTLTLPDVLDVGLVRGPDDTLHRTLEDLDIAHTVLDRRKLATTDLRQFSVLVLDMRTYHHRPDLADHRQRILDYCAGGGRVVVLYHKRNEWNAAPGKPLLSPYELAIGRDRVSEEDAAVTLLQPGDEIWTAPHRIGPEDFEGWVQERGLSFPEKWGEEWVPLIRMADSGEKPLDAGLLVAQHGKGRYVYCSLALYRQWRRGHEGALRILVNLLSPGSS